MHFTGGESACLRETLYYLNPDHSPADRLQYEKYRALYIEKAEGRVPHVYKDVLGLVTVGIGFNMDRKDARAEWHYAFGSGSVDFDEVYDGRRLLREEEIEHLFKSGLALREFSLRESYAEIWGYLRPNERLATESAYYNGACLVKGPDRDGYNQITRRDGIPEGATRYYTHLERYVLQKSVDDLHKATEELRERSNRRNIRGLAIRRAAEADLLSSFKIKGFSTVI